MSAKPRDRFHAALYTLGAVLLGIVGDWALAQWETVSRREVVVLMPGGAHAIPVETQRLRGIVGDYGERARAVSR